MVMKISPFSSLKIACAFRLVSETHSDGNILYSFLPFPKYTFKSLKENPVPILKIPKHQISLPFCITDFLRGSDRMPISLHVIKKINIPKRNHCLRFFILYRYSNGVTLAWYRKISGELVVVQVRQPAAASDIFVSGSDTLVGRNKPDLRWKGASATLLSALHALVAMSSTWRSDSIIVLNLSKTLRSKAQTRFFPAASGWLGPGKTTFLVIQYCLVQLLASMRSQHIVPVSCLKIFIKAFDPRHLLVDERKMCHFENSNNRVQEAFMKKIQNFICRAFLPCTKRKKYQHSESH